MVIVFLRSVLSDTTTPMCIGVNEKVFPYQIPTTFSTSISRTTVQWGGRGGFHLLSTSNYCPQWYPSCYIISSQCLPGEMDIHSQFAHNIKGISNISEVEENWQNSPHSLLNDLHGSPQFQVVRGQYRRQCSLFWQMGCILLLQSKQKGPYYCCQWGLISLGTQNQSNNCQGEMVVHRNMVPHQSCLTG